MLPSDEPSQDSIEFVDLAGGIRVAVPCSIERLTTYVLREPGDSEGARAHEPERTPRERLARLENAFRLALGAAKVGRTATRILTMDRLAFELGQRVAGLRALQVALRLMAAPGAGSFDEPFLVPSPRFEAFDPADRVDSWCLAAALEAQEEQRAFSSFFTGKSAIRGLERLKELGYLSGWMARRRYEVVRIRHSA